MCRLNNHNLTIHHNLDMTSPVNPVFRQMIEQIKKQADTLYKKGMKAEEIEDEEKKKTAVDELATKGIVEVFASVQALMGYLGDGPLRDKLCEFARTSTNGKRAEKRILKIMKSANTGSPMEAIILTKKFCDSLYLMKDADFTDYHYAVQEETDSDEEEEDPHNSDREEKEEEKD